MSGRRHIYIVLMIAVMALVTCAETVANPLFKLDSLPRPVHADAPPTIRPIGLFELSLGATLHTAAIAQASGAGTHTNYGTGFSAKIQNSILWNYRTTRAPKRFSWGDILSAEVFAGSLSTVMQHESGNVWLAYRFDFGFGARYSFSPKADAGLNLILLTFSRDNVSGNLSGSAVTGRFRYARILAEAGALARHERVGGVFTDLHSKTPLQSTFMLRYLFPGGRQIGVGAESLSGTYHQEGFQYTKIATVKVFYGIYF